MQWRFIWYILKGSMDLTKMLKNIAMDCVWSDFSEWYEYLNINHNKHFYLNYYYL